MTVIREFHSITGAGDDCRPICAVCGDRLCPHGICRKAELEYACQVCFCPDCGADLCPHGICSGNYCGHDHQCLECLDQRNLEQDAEDNFRYYERTENDDANDIADYLDDQRRKEAGFE